MKKNKVIIQLKSKKSKVIICRKTKKSKEIRYFNVLRDYEKSGKPKPTIRVWLPVYIVANCVLQILFSTFHPRFAR